MQGSPRRLARGRNHGFPAESIEIPTYITNFLSTPTQKGVKQGTPIHAQPGTPHLFISRYLVIDSIRWHLFSRSTGGGQWNAHGGTHPFRSLYGGTLQIQRCGVSSLEQSGRSYSCKEEQLEEGCCLGRLG